MAKSKSPKFMCSNCGNGVLRHMGQCPHCNQWNTIVEAPPEPSISGVRISAPRHQKLVRPLADFASNGTSYARLVTGIDELDFVLGGGIVPGSITLIGGEPGIGKSTILLQVATKLHVEQKLKVLYCSGEENGHQVLMRATRIHPGASSVEFVDETDIDALRATVIERRPDLLIIDSIQTMSTAEVAGDPGQVGQLRAVATRLQPLAKELNTAIFVIGHVTKDGTIAGPRLLEHYVDTTIYFEHVGDGEHRVMRAPKNRFGAADELGVFRMTPEGLEPVGNPSKIFLADLAQGVSGSAVTAVLEGTRPILIEAQALVTPASYGTPQRVATGFSRRRLALLLAILEKRAGYPMSQQDVFLNVAGGIEINDPAADAAILAALASSAVDRPLPAGALFLGEAGLGGELRRVRQLDRRLSEAAKLGFTNVYIPSGVQTKTPVTVHATGSIKTLLDDVLGPLPARKKKSRAAAQATDEDEET